MYKIHIVHNNKSIVRSLIIFKIKFIRRVRNVNGDAPQFIYTAFCSFRATIYVTFLITVTLPRFPLDAFR